ncbi:unnamed protein product [Phytophthora fragariaefolia]|uniref:Unnamed protein product n=1 Tax=Phytophthora fragariaefolia TaxID=1490495 RepID=A0A9W6XPY0_9STRA|nr:unnamed protein product [Phytophthora fragariaefolia]
MELHKEELLEYKRSMHNQPGSGRQQDVHRTSTSRERKNIHRSSKFNLPLLKLQSVAPLPIASNGTGANVKSQEPKFIPPQWQSTRAKAGSRLSVAIPALLDAPLEANDEPSPTHTAAIPPLDLSRLGRGPAIGVVIQEPDEPAQKQQKRKSFQATFQRQTRLAAMLRKKK